MMTTSTEAGPWTPRVRVISRSAERDGPLTQTDYAGLPMPKALWE